MNTGHRTEYRTQHRAAQGPGRTALGHTPVLGYLVQDFLSISFCPLPLVLLYGTTEQSLALQMILFK